MKYKRKWSKYQEKYFSSIKLFFDVALAYDNYLSTQDLIFFSQLSKF